MTQRFAAYMLVMGTTMSYPLTNSTPRMVEQVRTLVDRSPLPMVATEGHVHVVRYVNPAFGMRIGYAAEAIIGSSLKALVQDDDAGALLDLVYSTGSAEFAVDLARVFGTTHAIHVPCAVWPILGDDERPVGLLVQVSPSTELRDVNERLLVAGLEADAALTMRDEFISIAAHELRTPVTGIKLCAQLVLRTLEDATPDTQRIIRHLIGIEEGANRLVLLINDLMDVSRMRSGALLLRVTSLDLAGLVSTVALRYAEAGGERHPVRTHVPAEPLVIAGDAGRLEQILDNLLSNAVKYSPAGGEIGVSLRKGVDGTVLTVSDAGIGLTPGAQERIFEPFGRAANARRHGLPGMGLGLHICRQIAAAHGGRMWAESDGEGHGMTVVMWLPPA